MPRVMPLIPIPPADLPKVLGLPSAQEHKAKFPRNSLTGPGEAKAAFRKWQDAQKPATGPRNPDLKFTAVALDASRLAALRAVLDSDVAPAEMMKQSLDRDAFFGSLYSALAAYELIKLESEFKRRTATAQAAKATREWASIVRAAQLAFAAGGLTTPDAGAPSQYARVLSADKKALNAIIRVAGSGTGTESSVLDGSSRAVGAFVPIVDHIRDTTLAAVHIGDLCAAPIVQGTFTKHFVHSFALSVRLRVWCPTWTNPFRTCVKTFVIAGVSFNVGVNVGYRVNCCGATAWGQAHAQACATVLGATVCAGCTATVTGVAGVSRTTVAAGCSYGLGLTAALTCTLFGQTLFTASVTFGYTITGPCPPLGLCA